MLVHTGSLEPMQLLHNFFVEERIVRMGMGVVVADNLPAPIEACRVKPVASLDLKARPTP